MAEFTLLIPDDRLPELKEAVRGTFPNPDNHTDVDLAKKKIYQYLKSIVRDYQKKIKRIEADNSVEDIVFGEVDE